MRLSLKVNLPSLLAIAVYLFSCAASFGGVTLCTGVDGQARLEISCSHEHCPATSLGGCHHAGQDHDCESCPCEDDAPELLVATLGRGTAGIESSASATPVALVACEPATDRHVFSRRVSHCIAVWLHRSVEQSIRSIVLLL